MKKLLTLVSAFVFASFGANAETRIGLSGAYTMFSTDGTETVKSSAQKIQKHMMMKLLYLQYLWSL